jgi:sulfatase maturation enzyme AslB (radical SAM superfamily)
MIKYINLHLSYLCNFNCDYCFLTKKAINTRSSFTRWDDLLIFLQNAPLEDEIVIMLVSGELSIRHKLVENAYNKIKKIERLRDVKVSFGMYSNGTDMRFILDLLDRGILNPKYTSISWDGINNSHRCTDKQAIKLINNNILLLGKSRFKDTVLIRSALTTDYLDHIDETLKFINESGCTNWEYYVLIDNKEYTPITIYTSDKNTIRFHEALDNALVKMFSNKIKPYNYNLIKNSDNTPPLTEKKSWCRIGNSIDISKTGKILPCGAFTKQFKYPYPSIHFDDLLDKFNQEKINHIIKEECFDKNLTCMDLDPEPCNETYCTECPRLVKYRTIEINKPHLKVTENNLKLMTLCMIRYYENYVYNKLNNEVKK